jgi:hypothetical protein
MPLYTSLRNLLNVLVQTANKMGLQREIPVQGYCHMTQYDNFTSLICNYVCPVCRNAQPLCSLLPQSTAISPCSPAEIEAVVSLPDTLRME